MYLPHVRRRFGPDATIVPEGRVGVRQLLRRCPWIARDEGGLVGKVLVDGSPLTGESVDSEWLRLGCEGLAGLHVYALAGIREDAWPAVDRSDVPVTLFDLGDNDNPLNAYCNS
jgi:hypothetical protein